MLPIEWVDRLFHKLALVYGVDIAKRYSGLNPAEVKREWAQCLAGFKHRPEAIRFQFRDICRQAPMPAQRALPEPKADKYVVTKEMAKLVKEAFTPGDPKAWAYHLKARHEKGEALSLVQVKAYREALNDTKPADS